MPIARAVIRRAHATRPISSSKYPGSALGATLLVLLFHHLGWAQLHALFPAMLDSPGWQRAVAWTGDYGVIALFAIAALPLPQTPALIFFAITEPPVAKKLPNMFGAVYRSRLCHWFPVSASDARASLAGAAGRGAGWAG